MTIRLVSIAMTLSLLSIAYAAELEGQQNVNAPATRTFNINGDASASLGHDASYFRGIVVNSNMVSMDKTKIATVDINVSKSTWFTKNDDGYHFTLDPMLLENEKKSIETGVEIVNQVSGTPPIFPTGHAKPSFGHANYFPLPDEGSPMEDWQHLFIEWVTCLDKAVGGDAYHSIWLGTQEPTHTLGESRGHGYESKAEAEKEENISSFADFWRPIAKGLRAKGALVGGIQLNSGYARHYQRAIDILKEKDLELDFLTFQMYQLADPECLDLAIEALKSYRAKYPRASILINRGLWFKQMESESKERVGRRAGHDTSRGMIYFLRAEKLIQERSDFIYGYCIGKPGTDDNMTWTILRWLDEAPKGRRTLNGMPSGIDGFFLSDDSKGCVAVWNDNAEACSLNVSISHFDKIDGGKMRLLAGSGTKIHDCSDKIHLNESTIEGISLESDQFALLSFYSSR